MTRSEELWVSGLAGTQQVVLTDFFDLWWDTRLDQSETFGFTIPAADPRAEFVVEDGEVRWRDRRFIVRRLQHVRSGSETVVEVECDAIWYRLGEKVRVGSVNILDTTIADGLDTILAGSGWTRDAPTTSASATQYAMELQDETVLAAVRRWARVTGTFVTFNHAERTVTLSASRGRNLGLGFRYGRNVTAIRREVTPPFATRLYPYGADGLDITGVNTGLPYLDDFTWYTGQGLSLATAQERFTKSRVWSDPTFTEDATLKAAAQVKLARWAQPTVTYECQVTDLTELTGVLEDPRPGDSVRVADEVLGFDVATTVVRFRKYPLEPWRNQVELAYLPDLATDDELQRSQSSREWLMFKSDNKVLLELRSDGSWVTNRIGLAFREGGEAVFGFDVTFTGVDAGTWTIEFIDADESPAAEVHEPIVIAYTNGETIKTTATWALKELAGQYDYRVRMTAVASGGPSALDGIDIDVADSRFWILAHGAVRQTPVVPTEERFDRDPDLLPAEAGVQTFTVPDNVTEVEIEVGGAGTEDAVQTPYVGGQGGAGCVITARMIVVPGQTIEVNCGHKGGRDIDSENDIPVGGWPNGGNGDSNAGPHFGHGGGGSTDIRPPSGAFSAAYIVAGAAGGPCRGDSGGAGGNGGNGGFLVGYDGTSSNPIGWHNFGGGATRTTGGVGGTGCNSSGPAGNPTLDGFPGTFGDGGNAYDGTDTFQEGPGGGGGGGWYGGGGAGFATANTIAPPGGGGGGSSYVSSSVFDVEATDGGNPDAGYVIFRWDDPFTDI